MESGFRTATRRLVLIFLVLVIGVHHTLGSEPTRILFLSSYHPSYPSVEWQIRGFRDGLAQGGWGPERLLLDVEYLDSKRFPDGPEADYLRKNMEKRLELLPPYAVVACADDNALNYGASRSPELWDAPMVFLGINDVASARRWSASSRITGVVETIPFRENLNLIDTLHPQAETIVVISDATVTGRSLLVGLLEAYDSSEHPPLTVYSLDDYSYDDLFRVLSQVDEQTPTLLLTGYRDKNGQTAELVPVVGRLDDILLGPLYHVQCWGIGHGAVAGVVIDQYEQGRLAGLLAAEQLNGQRLPPIWEVPGRTTVDWVEFNRMGLRAGDLPSETVFLNRPLWLGSLTPVLRFVVFGSFGIAILIIIALLVLSQIRKTANRNLMGTVARQEETLRSTYNSIAEREWHASLGEFVGSLAHELNTPIGICVTSASFLKEYLTHRSPGENVDEQEAHREAMTAIDLAERNLRKAFRIIDILRSVARERRHENCREVRVDELIDESLFALQTELKNASIQVQRNIEAVLVLRTRPLALQHILWDLLGNVLSHAFVGREDQRILWIHGSYRGEGVRLVIEDNGVGIPKGILPRVTRAFVGSKRPNGHVGLGLFIVYTTVTGSLFGHIHLDSEENRGTRLTIDLPNMED